MATQKIHEEVSVSLIFDSKTKRVYPKSIFWNNRTYNVIKVGLHHKYKKGKSLFHVFSVLAGATFFRLIFNTDNLHWSLEEVEVS